MNYILLTPGPLTTHRDVRTAMMREYGSRDEDFEQLITHCRIRLTNLALGQIQERPLPDSHFYPTIFMQGSGTFALEAMLTSFVHPPDDHLLILSNGAYGERLHLIAQARQLPHSILRHQDHIPLPCDILDDYLNKNNTITHLAFVHCETSTGMQNPLEDIALIAKKHDIHLMVDAMSSFAIHPLNMKKHGIASLVASANKGIEGVAGLAFVIAQRDFLEKKRPPCNSLVLDLKAQNDALERTHQFRFTPPPQILAALDVALHRLIKEGGTHERHKRYTKLCHQLRTSMQKLGFVPYLKEHHQSPMIVAFHTPPQLNFDEFYRALKKKSFLIYKGNSKAHDTFRIGCIGAITTEDMARFLEAVAISLDELKIRLVA